MAAPLPVFSCFVAAASAGFSASLAIVYKFKFLPGDASYLIYVHTVSLLLFMHGTLNEFEIMLHPTEVHTSKRAANCLDQQWREMADKSILPPPFNPSRQPPSSKYTQK